MCSAVEHPTREDFNLFRTVICNLCNDNTSLPVAVGPYINHPHRQDVWFVSEDRLELYKLHDNSSYSLFACSERHRQTRQGTRYAFLSMVAGQCDRSTCASVHCCPIDGDLQVVHSTCPVYIPSSTRRSFLERLQALPNQSLWYTFTTDGDGSWIYRSLIAGDLIIMSDGSYNDNVALDVCSCAVVFCDRVSGATARVAWVEKSDPHTADNYCAELLGSIAIQLLLQVAREGKYIPRDLPPHSAAVITKRWCGMAIILAVQCQRNRPRQTYCATTNVWFVMLATNVTCTMSLDIWIGC